MRGDFLRKVFSAFLAVAFLCANCGISFAALEERSALRSQATVEMLPARVDLGAEPRSMFEQRDGTVEVDRGDCGVYAHIGPAINQGGIESNAALYQGLKELEYRGYQSSGYQLMRVRDGEAQLLPPVRSLGGADPLRPSIETSQDFDDSTMQIGHLRWPTTGRATVDNAHPQSITDPEGEAGTVSIVFNGDVHNYQAIDARLAEAGIVRPENVQTDAWTIAGLVLYHLRQVRRETGQSDVREAVRRAYAELDGYFALVVVADQDPTKMIGAVKGNMPLIAGVGEEGMGNFLCSEPGGVVRYTPQAVFLRSGDIAEVTADSIRVYRVNEGGVLTALSDEERPAKQLNPEQYLYVLRPENSFYMQQEIGFQPAATAQTLYGYVPSARGDDGELLPAETLDAIRQALIEGRDVPPSDVQEDRVGVIERMIQHPGSFVPMPGINLDQKGIRSAQRCLAIASGTSGYAIEGSKAAFESYTGLPVATWTGTEYSDMMIQKLRSIWDAIAQAHPSLVNGVFENNVFPAVPAPRELIALIDRLSRLVDQGHAAKIPELRSFAQMRAESQETIGIAVSQSGGTKDTHDAMEVAQALGVRFIAIVNKPGETPIGTSGAEDAGLFRTYAGTEKGVASSKAHTAQEMALYTLGLYLGLARGRISPNRAQQRLDALRQLPGLAQAMIENPELRAHLRAVAHKIRSQRAILYLGRGSGTSTTSVAREGALKLKELTYMLAEGQNLGEMKHGPISFFAATQDERHKSFAVVVATDRGVLDKSLLNIREVLGRDGRAVVVCFASDAERVTGAEDLILIPDISDNPVINDEFAPLLAVIPLQLLAYETTLAIDELSQELSDFDSRIYWAARGGDFEMGALGAADELSRWWSANTANGNLDLVEPAKVEHVNGRLVDLRTAAATQDRQGINGVLIELADQRLQTILFFEHILENPQGIDAQDMEQIRQAFAMTETPEFLALTPQEKTTRLYETLNVVLTQSASRGHVALKEQYEVWMKRLGLAFYLARDPDKPRSLAKVVTVEHRLEAAMRQAIEGLPISRAAQEQIIREGAMRLQNGRITGRLSTIQLLSDLSASIPELETMTPAQIMREGYFHENIHVLLDNLPAEMKLYFTRLMMEHVVNAYNAAHPAQSFQDAFEAEFGPVGSEEELAFETIAKYYTYQFSGRPMPAFLAETDGRIENIADRIRLEYYEEFDTSRFRGELVRAGMLAAPMDTLAALLRWDVPQGADDEELMRNEHVAEVSALNHTLGHDVTLYFETVVGMQEFEAEVAQAQRVVAPHRANTVSAETTQATGQAS